MSVDRWIDSVSLVTTVGAILFAIWAYRRGEKRRLPTIVTAPNPEVLIKPVVRRLKDFSVTYKGNAVGNEGVSALFVYFWNDGQLPILRPDITSPYTIHFPDNVKILDLAVTKTTRSILGINAEVLSEQTHDSVVVSFAVLEPGDGLKLQIIFDGPPNAQIDFEGSCIGSARVRVLAPDWTYFLNRGKRFEETYTPVVMALVLSLFGAGVGGIMNLIGKFLKPSLGRTLGVGLMILLGFGILWAIGAILYGWYKKWTASSVPPEIRES